jgi:hypothetical protein
VFQAAVSKRTGRSHVKDSWELELKKGERVKILKYMGNDWFFVEDRRKQNGWVHGAWLDFQQMIPHVDPREAYARFTVDVEKMLKAGNIRTFPVLSRYMNACAKEVCSPLKKDTHCLGICIHDLHELMHGSGDYCLDTLKLERNKWHPDRFARYCHPEHREFLREKAQVLFVLERSKKCWSFCWSPTQDQSRYPTVQKYLSCRVCDRDWRSPYEGRSRDVGD